MVMTSYLKWSGNPGKGGVPHLDYISLVICETSLKVKLWIKALKKGGRRWGRSAVPGVRPKGSGDIVTSVPDLYLGCWELKWMVLTTRQVLLFSCLYVPLPTFYCSHSSLAERLGDDIKVVEYVICIKASPHFFSPSTCLFSCLYSIPVAFCPPLQTSHPLAQLINDCFNNITAPPFSCVNDPSDMWLVIRSGRDFYFHPLKGHKKYRE